jgi:hypothetical protein
MLAREAWGWRVRSRSAESARQFIVRPAGAALGDCPCERNLEALVRSQSWPERGLGAFVGRPAIKSGQQARRHGARDGLVFKRASSLPSLGESDERDRVHHRARRRGRVAARGAGTAAGDVIPCPLWVLGRRARYAAGGGGGGFGGLGGGGFGGLGGSMGQPIPGLSPAVAEEMVTHVYLCVGAVGATS